MGNVEENTYKTKMSDQQDIFNIRKQMLSADHEVVTVSRNIVTVIMKWIKKITAYLNS